MVSRPPTRRIVHIDGNRVLRTAWRQCGTPSCLSEVGTPAGGSALERRHQTYADSPARARVHGFSRTAAAVSAGLVAVSSTATTAFSTTSLGARPASFAAERGTHDDSGRQRQRLRRPASYRARSPPPQASTPRLHHRRHRRRQRRAHHRDHHGTRLHHRRRSADLALISPRHRRLRLRRAWRDDRLRSQMVAAAADSHALPRRSRPLSRSRREADPGIPVRRPRRHQLLHHRVARRAACLPAQLWALPAAAAVAAAAAAAAPPPPLAAATARAAATALCRPPPPAWEVGSQRAHAAHIRVRLGLGRGLLRALTTLT